MEKMTITYYEIINASTPVELKWGGFAVDSFIIVLKQSAGKGGFWDSVPYVSKDLNSFLDSRTANAGLKKLKNNYSYNLYNEDGTENPNRSAMDIYTSILPSMKTDLELTDEITIKQQIINE